MLKPCPGPPQRSGLWRAWIRQGAATTALACASVSASAITLGQFVVESGLGQPLRAAIDITHYKVEDLRRLQVQLAKPASFEQAGMAFHPALEGVQTRLEFRGDGKPFIALTGLTPINEHFLDLIVEAQWPAGRLAMNYTLLISPVGAIQSAPGKATSAVTPLTAVIAPVVGPAVTPPALATPLLSLASNDPAVAAPAITVRAGDTASALLTPRLPAGVSLDQMLLAMVRANPEAFIEGNVNLLREGALVELPSAEAAAQWSAEEARQTVIAQTVDFVAYARRLAQSALPAPETASREAMGLLGPAPTPQPARPQPPQDKLTLSQRDTTTGNAEARLAVEREIQDKTEQLAALKKNLESLTALSATPDTSQPPSSPSEASATSSALTPNLPLAASEALKNQPWLERIGGSPSLWAWLLALLAGMTAWVWVVRRRPATPADLFGRPAQQAPRLEPFPESTAQARATAPSLPVAPPLGAGLPPQFAHLDLNLTPAPDTRPDPAAAPAQGPQA